MPPDQTKPTEPEVTTPTSTDSVQASPETASLETTPEPAPPSETLAPEVPPEAVEAPREAVDMPSVNNDISTPEPAVSQSPEPHIRPAGLSTPSFDAQSQPSNIIGDLLQKAKSAIQNRKTKKLEKILVALDKKNKISNDEVQKLLNVSDATATRYLSLLEQQGKIKQAGKTGKYTFYTKI